MRSRVYIIQLLSSSFFLLGAFIPLILICAYESYAQSKQSTSLSIEKLRQRTYKATLTFEKKLQDTEKCNASLYSYFSDGLKIYA